MDVACDLAHGVAQKQLRRSTSVTTRVQNVVVTVVLGVGLPRGVI
jgi:hypothetical protein